MKLSIGMMVKNEAKNLERCLQSIKPIRDAIDSELVIIDTGSSDNTVEIAQRYTDKVYFHEWDHNFSEMRNKTISYAKGEWFLVIDADEVLESPQAIVDFLNSKESDDYNAAVLFVKNLTGVNELKDFSTLLSARLFRKNDNFHYEGAVHNQAIFDEPVADLKTYLIHYGYMANDPELMERKFIRTSAILKSELEKDPEHIYYLYQLAVTYAMHGDYDDAIHYIQQAYEVFAKLGKPKNCMYVLTHMALIYQITRNFEKVEEVCLEALQVSDGYIDIYYYLAESQAIQGKHQAAIHNYHHYLELLANYHDFTQKDGGVIEYSVGNAQLAYFNLSALYRWTGDFHRALEYGEKVTDSKTIQENLSNVIYLYLKLGKYKELRNYYDQVIPAEGQTLFYEKMEDNKREFGDTTRDGVAQEFSDLANQYGLFNRVITEVHIHEFSPETLAAVQRIDFSILPLYCSDLLYYLLKGHYPLEQALTNFKEIWLNSLVVYIENRRDNLGRALYEYLQTYRPANNISEHKLSKTLCRYALMLNELDHNEYQDIFERYLRDGISYMKLLYNPCVLADELVYEVKNDEEVFLIYMYYAQMNKNVQQAESIQYLRKALEVFPGMKKGIELLLNGVQRPPVVHDEEFASYTVQVKASIQQLIDSGKLDEAKLILAEYKSIVPNDPETSALEAKILLH